MANIDIEHHQMRTRARAIAASHSDYARLRWSAKGYDGRLHYGPVIAAIVPAVGILAIAASLLLAVL